MIAKLIFNLKGEVINKINVPKGSKGSITIGRDNSCNVSIPSGFVSSKHTEIISDGFNIYINDLQSRNGTFLNGKKIVSGQREKIGIGDVITFSADATIQLLVMHPESVAQSSVSKKRIQTVSSGSDLMSILNNKGKALIGRSDNCDKCIKDESISRRHAVITKEGNRYFIQDTSRNGTYVNGNLVGGVMPLEPSDEITICGYRFKISDNISHSGKAPELKHNLPTLLKSRKRIVIGRDVTADLQINDPHLSRKHIEIIQEKGCLFITDLGSTNGTYINDQRIYGKTRLGKTDEIQIGQTKFKLDEFGVMTEINLSDEVAIRAENVYKEFTKTKNGKKIRFKALKEMSVVIPNKAFVALMGPSGCGKSTLMNSLNGTNPATGGEVFIHGLNLKENFKQIKSKIGFVPQDDIVHKDLSVKDSLRFAAKIRLPYSSEEVIQERIKEVLKDLNISEHANKLVSELSGG